MSIHVLLERVDLHDTDVDCLVATVRRPVLVYAWLFCSCFTWKVTDATVDGRLQGKGVQPLRASHPRSDYPTQILPSSKVMLVSVSRPAPIMVLCCLLSSANNSCTGLILSEARNAVVPVAYTL